MPKIVGIKFNKNPKIYSFAAGEHEYTLDGGVIVETARGLEFGRVATMPVEQAEVKLVSPLKPVIRIADEKDEKKIQEIEKRHDETMRICLEHIEKSKLDMKLIDVEYTFDESKLTVHFSAEGRVDFRELVKKLASVFRTRIELRQIGARDECRMLGGLAPCGQECCCARYLKDYPHVSIKMAKNQNLSLNPAKISGLCGRLMCCLEYENAHYAETNKRMPKLGAIIKTEDGKEGQVVATNQIKETVRLKITDKDEIIFCDMPLESLKFKAKSNQDEPLKEENEEKEEILDEELKDLINN